MFLFWLTLIIFIVSVAGLVLGVFALAIFQKSFQKSDEPVSLTGIVDSIERNQNLPDPGNTRLFRQKWAFERSKTLFHVKAMGSFMVKDVFKDILSGNWSRENLLKLLIIVSFFAFTLDFFPFTTSFLIFIFNLPGQLFLLGIFGSLCALYFLNKNLNSNPQQ